MARILVVEDEVAIADTLVFALQAEGHQVEWRSQGEQALALVEGGGVDLVLLDVGLPDLSGFEVCRRLRRQSDVPVLFLTARGEEIDRVVGLELGADDYVVKPFSPRELVARVRGILRRAGGGATATGTNATTATASAANATGHARPIATGPFQLDVARREIAYQGRPLALTRQEYLILCRLLAAPGEVCTREQLLEAAGTAAEAGYERNIDGHIRSLRAKLRAIDPGADPIHTHRGFGYSLEVAAQ